MTTPDLFTGGRFWLPAAQELEANHPGAVRELCAALGLDTAMFEDHRARIPLRVALRFLRKATAISGDPLFALRAGRRYDRSSFDLLVRALLVQPDGNAAMARARRFADLVIEGLEITYLAEGDLQRVIFSLHGRPLGDPLLSEYLIALGSRLIEHVGLPSLVVVDVELPHEPLDARARYRECCPAPIHFDAPRCSFALPDVDLDLPSADPVLADLLEHQAEAVIADLPRWASHRGRVETFLDARLGRASVGVSDAARSLGMSVRTLRRRLEDEGTTYAEVLDGHRRDRVLSLLDDRDLSIAEIAHRAGFASSSAFRRAFARWEGTNASRYRARLEER